MNHHPSRSHAFTLIELVATIATVAVLITIAAGTWISTIKRGHATQCLANLRTIGAATMAYAGDNDMTLPATSHQRRAGLASWSVALQPYASGKLSFRCPADEDANRAFSYVINDFLTPNPAGARDLDFSRLARLERPGATILFAEAVSELNSDHFHFATYRGRQTPIEAFAAQVAVDRHEGRANYLFADGHVEALSRAQVEDRLNEPRSRFVDPTGQEPAPNQKP